MPVIEHQPVLFSINRKLFGRLVQPLLIVNFREHLEYKGAGTKSTNSR